MKLLLGICLVALMATSAQAESIFDRYGGSGGPSTRFGGQASQNHQQAQVLPKFSGGAINPQTGEFYPYVGGGTINPQTGEFYPDVSGGAINPRTGQFYPSVGGAAIDTRRHRAGSTTGRGGAVDIFTDGD